MKTLQTYLRDIILLTIILALGILLFSQCSKTKKANNRTAVAELAKKKSDADYLELVKAKTKIDTFYKEGDTKYVPKKVPYRVTDTLYIEGGKVYGLFKDSIKNEDLTLHAEVVASDMKSIAYTYNVRERVITNNTITPVHDTIPMPPKGHIYALSDAGLNSYSLGLYYQTRKRMGFTARYTRINGDKEITAGIAYRLY